MTPMRRNAMLGLLLGAVALLVVWRTAQVDSDVGRGPGSSDAEGADATLAGRASPGADEDPAPLKTLPVAAPDSRAGRRLAEAVERLKSLRAGFEVGAVSVVELAEAERQLLLARVEAGDLAKQEAYAQLVRLDAGALARTEALYENMLCTQEVLWRARLRLHQSKHGAGHADARFAGLREEFLLFLEQGHDALVQAAVSSPGELHRRLLDACLEFPLDAGVRDLALERAGGALRDRLVSELRQMQSQDAPGPLLARGERQVELELEIWELRLLLGDVDFHTAHAERARIYERTLRDLESREVGLVPSAGELAIARLRLHREEFLLEEDDEEYASLRAHLLLAEEERLDTLVANGRLSRSDRAVALENLRVEFPPAVVLRAARDGD